MSALANFPQFAELSAKKQPAIVIRKAAMSDIPELMSLINAYAANGVMLPRTEFELSENIRDFSIAFSDERIAGCGALHFYSPVAAEIRSLAVSPQLKTLGIGRLLIDFLIQEALTFNLAAVFAFTYVPGFFGRVGFREIERGILPLKAWKDCLRCAKFHDCDEIAVLRVLDGERWPATQLTDDSVELPVLFPILKS